MRLDWPKIKALSVEAGFLPEDSALFILPLSGRDLLMSIMERFEWEATFRVPNYDFSDWDFLQSIVASTENGLMGFVMMDDITEQLSRIADSLEVIQDCCTIPILTDINETISNLELSPVVNVDVDVSGSGSNFVDKTWLLPEGWQSNHPTTPTEPSDTPTEEETSYICDSAHSAHFELVSWIALFADNVANQSPYTDIWEALAESTLFHATASQLYAVLSSFTSLLYNNLNEDSIAFMESIKDEFVCQMVNAETAVNFDSWFSAKIRDDAPNWTVGFWLETLYTGTSFNSIFDGTYVPLPEFEGSDCEGCIPLPEFPAAPSGYTIVYPESGQVSFNNQENGAGSFDGNYVWYNAASGEWNGSYVNFDTLAIRDSVSGVRIDGWMMERVSCNGADATYDKVDFTGTNDFTMLSSDTIGTQKLYYNSSFASELAAFAALFDESAAYGSSPVSIGTAVNPNGWQSVSRFTPREYSYRVAFLVKL